jgi:hypothetical protein
MADEVVKDTVYREMYTEMRRFRDYEFSSSTWFTALLLGIFAFVVMTRHGDASASLKTLFNEKCFLRCLLVICSAVPAAASTFLIHHTRSRYLELRDWMDKNLEPSWKNGWKPSSKKFEPHLLLYGTPWVIFLLILLAAWL